MGRQLGWVWFGGLKSFIFYNTQPFFEILDPESDSMLIEFPSNHLSYPPNVNIVNGNLNSPDVYIDTFSIDAFLPTSQRLFLFDNKIYHIPLGLNSSTVFIGDSTADTTRAIIPKGALGIHDINNSYTRTVMNYVDFSQSDSFFANVMTDNGVIYCIPYIDRRFQPPGTKDHIRLFAIIDLKTNTITFKDLGINQLLGNIEGVGTLNGPNYVFAILLGNKIYCFPLDQSGFRDQDIPAYKKYGFLVIDITNESIINTTLGIELDDSFIYPNGILYNNKIYSLIINLAQFNAYTYTASISIFSIDLQSNTTISPPLISFDNPQDAMGAFYSGIPAQGGLILCSEGSRLYIIKHHKVDFMETDLSLSATINKVYAQDTIYSINLENNEVNTITLSQNVLGVVDAVALNGKIYLSCTGRGMFDFVEAPSLSEHRGLFVVNTANGNVKRVTERSMGRSIMVTGDIKI
jgi:hypothetical protein